MMHGQRYYDKDGATDSMGMQDVEDYTSDYYENQPGDAISSTTNHRRTRKKNTFALAMLTVGTLMVVGGIGFAMRGKEEEQAISSSSMANSSPNDKRPDFFDASPTKAPVTAPAEQVPTATTPTPQETETPATLGPTHASIYDFIVTLVGETALLDANSLASRALSWLEETPGTDRLSNERLRQRFSLACLYMGTTQKSEWTNDNGWMSKDSECTWYGVECKNHKLIALNLTDNGLGGLVPWEITLLKDYLISLELASNDLLNEGSELAWMGELTNLRMFDVEQTYFSYDGIPPYISKLTELKILDISETLFMGELDGAIFAPLTQLMYLEMGGNLYNSTLPQQISKLPNLEALYAYDSGLKGELDFLPNLSQLVEIWLDGNPDLGGTIPTEVGRLTNLASLSVTNCDMWGQIPSEFGKLTMMEQVWLYGNWFSGTIPSEFASLPKLQILGLEDNNITDVSMPKELCAKDMMALSSDCSREFTLVDCTCCTCCEAPCPVVNLPVYNSGRLLEVQDEIRRL